MPPRTSPIVDVKDLSDAQQDALAARMFAVHDQIFSGSSLEDFRGYLVRPETVSSRVQLLEVDDDVVGYAILHAYELDLLGRRSVVVRSGIGMLRVHRGNGMMGQFGASELTRLLARYPTRPAYAINFSMHPSSYAVVTRYMSEYAPKHDAAPTDEQNELTRAIVAHLGMPLVDPADPWVVDTHWVTRVSPEEQAYWLKSTKPAVRFFVARNPGFVHGNALCVLNRLTPGQVATGVGRVAWTQVKRKLTRAGAVLQRAGLGTSIPTGAARARLAAAPAFAGASPELLDRLASAATTRTVPVGDRVFRAGDPSTELFVIDRGLAEVLVGDEEIPVDTVQAGEVVGEVGVLLDRPRAETVRAATDLTVLVVPRAAARAVLQADPMLRRRLLTSAAGRVADEVVRQSMGALPRTLGEPELVELDAGASRDLGGGWTVLAQGTVAIEAEPGFTLASAPAACRAGRARAVTPAIVLVYPSEAARG